MAGARGRAPHGTSAARPHKRLRRMCFRCQPTAKCPRTPLSPLLPTFEAHCTVSTHYSLPSPPYPLPDGSPLHSVHALPSPLFSLPSTRRKPTAQCPRTALSPLLPSPSLTEAHCIVSTHCPLPSPPSSLLPPPSLRSAHCIVSTHCPLPSPLSSLPEVSPLHSVHALPSPLSSLLPTFEAHCIVSTHCPLPSPPYPLPDGSPLHSVRALPSPLSPLLPPPYF